VWNGCEEIVKTRMRMRFYVIGEWKECGVVRMVVFGVTTERYGGTAVW
jgi:hypothetical protein